MTSLAVDAAPHRVLCFGNELHGDDGFALAVGRQLAAQGLPAGWSLHEVGTRGLDALALLLDCQTALLLDAAQPAGQPGRLAELDPRTVPVETGLAGHAMGLGYTLQVLRSSGAPWPALRLLTAEMAAVQPYRLGLSAAVQQAVAPAVQQVRAWMQAQDTVEPAP